MQNLPNSGMKIFESTDNVKMQDFNNNFTEADKKFKEDVADGAGHNHNGTAGQGPKISYNDLNDTPEAGVSQQAFDAHLAESASLTAAGHVQLQTTVNTSEAKALTPKALNNHQLDYVRQPGYGTTAGTSTAYTLTLSPALASYMAGVGISIRMHTTCAASPTININGLGAKALKKQDGTTYAAGELVSGSIYSFRYDGTSFLADSSGGMDEFFGDGSDGALNTTGNVTIPVTAQSGIAIKQYTSIDINAGHTLTTDNPCRGLILYSQGDVNVSGTIDMSQKAGIAPNGNIIPMVLTKKIGASTIVLDKYNKLTAMSYSSMLLLGGTGGNGGYGGGLGGLYRSTGGTGGAGRQNLGGYGGGGGGGGSGGYSLYGGQFGGNILYAELGGGEGTRQTSQMYNSGPAANVYAAAYTNERATCGAGGAGSATGNLGATGNSIAPGSGKAGNCNGGGGGGSGGVASSGTYSSPSADNGQYSGGFILIISKGNVMINATGQLKANGGNGGSGSSGGAGAAGGGGGGGGAGGGVIALFYKGIFNNAGSIQVNAGSGGVGGAGLGSGETGGSGTSGSVGTIHTQQL